MLFKPLGSLLIVLLTLSSPSRAERVDCKIGGRLDGSDLLTRVNKQPDSRLLARFVPPQLVAISSHWIASGKSGEPLRADVVPWLEAMLGAAESQGHKIRVYSAYRSFHSQCGTYQSKFSKFRSVYKDEEELAQYVKMISAEPGRSEHQLGTTVDLVYPSLGNRLAFPDLPSRCGGKLCQEYAWLRSHAHLYGFALSYPRPQTDVRVDMNPKTGYMFEPWHWRFIGVEHATRLFELNQTASEPVSIDEYLGALQTGGERGPSSVVGEFSIGMGGDVSLSRTGVAEVDPRGATHGRFYKWDEMTSGLQELTEDNEINFMNLESVVTDRRDLSTDQKFSQRSHPKGVEYLIKQMGFNMVSAANNHMTDFGQEGLNETHALLESLKQSGSLLAYSGLGTDTEVATPSVFEINGVKIAFAAIGMKGDGREDRGRPSVSKVGMLSIRRCGDGSNEREGQACPKGYADYERVLEGLRRADADLRIVSIHEGTELAVHVNPSLAPDNDSAQTRDGRQRQRRETRNVVAKFDLAERYGVDMIIGHHSHNARPIRLRDNKLALFGLGNFLFLGGQNYDRGFPDWNRYGLFARAHFSVDRGVQGGRVVRLSALEVIPLRSVHVQPRPWEAADSAGFISYLNTTAKKNFGETGVIFQVTPRGSGVYCVPGVPRGLRTQALCSGQ